MDSKSGTMNETVMTFTSYMCVPTYLDVTFFDRKLLVQIDQYVSEFRKYNDNKEVKDLKLW